MTPIPALRFLPAAFRRNPAPVDLAFSGGHVCAMTMTQGLGEDERAEWIAAIAQKRDREAFARLFAFYAPRLKRNVMRFGLTADAAEDVVQEAMLALWAKAAQFDPARGTPSAWIFTLAANARIDRQRKALKEAKLKAEDLPGPEGPDLEAAMIASQSGENVSGAMRQLSPPQRTIIEMSFFQDAPHSAIAVRLGLPVGTVKSRIRLAIAKLRRALGDES